MSDNLHGVVVEIDGYGTPTFSFRCYAASEDDPACHMTCERSSCEEGCIDSEAHGPGFVNQGACMICLWLDESDAAECIDGGSTEIELPIDYVWHGDGVDWKFKAAKP